MGRAILPGMLKSDPRNAKPDLQTWQLAFDQLKPRELTIGPTKIQKKYNNLGVVQIIVT